MTSRARSAALLAGLMVVSLLTLASPTQAAPVPDGSTPERAAASCWEIKQVSPSSPSGLYWLVTPRLQTPTQFRCDQETAGGGWVMVARGRQAWSESGDGQGTTAEVGAVDTGTSAFRAKQLSNRTIDGLLNGGRVDALPDGIRLDRALNSTGTQTQDVRFKLTSGTRDRWSWALSAGLPVSYYSVDGVATTKAQTTRNMTLSNDTQRTWNFSTVANAYVRGFTYGQRGPAGANNFSSYLYSKISGGQFATPFTRMYVRPRLLTSGVSYAAIPDSGTAPTTAAPVPLSTALDNPWGVTGLGAGGSLDYATEVSAFAQIGNRMFVGGNFTTVQRGDGSSKTSQPYLAAFDATTGEWISSFRPRFNNQVKALAVLPNGRLAVGGEFTTLNGKTATNLVVLDPTTGAHYTTFKAKFGQTTSGAKRWVRSLDVSGSYLYVGGGFSHYTGGSATKNYAFRNIVRVTATAGTPNVGWRPNLGTGVVESNGKRTLRTSVLDLDVADDGKMVYAAGQFQQGYVGDDGKTAVSKPGVAAITTGTSATFKSWPVVFSTATKQYRYSQAVEQVGSRVWVGSSQHSLFAYLASTLKIAVSNITLGGGDLQAIDDSDGVVYASCHCNEWNYSGTTRFDTPRGQGAKQIDRIGRVGAWNASTGAYYPEFAPYTNTRAAEGPWAVHSATDGTLWAGGDYTSTIDEDGTSRWTGGFIRYPMRPHTPPAAPRGLSVSLDGSTATVRWSASATSNVSYEVIRNDRVVGVTSTGATSATVPSSASGDRWFVRASDGRGNRSASTPVARSTAAAAETATLIAPNDYWAYWFKDESPAPEWKTVFDDTGWTYGRAPLGYGASGLGTELTKPDGVVRAYFRRTLKVDDVSDYSAITVRTRADDGAVVMVNGTELRRRRVTAGVTWADSAVSTAAATAEDWTFTIPLDLLRDGTNHIAVDVRANSNSSANLTHQSVVTGTLK